MDKPKQISNIVDGLLNGTIDKDLALELLIVITNDGRYKEGQAGILAQRYNKVVGVLGCPCCGGTTQGFIDESVKTHHCSNCGHDYLACPVAK